MRIRSENLTGIEHRSAEGSKHIHSYGKPVEPKDSFQGETIDYRVAGKMTILHTNDMHGHAEAMVKKGEDESAETGGLANLAGLIKQEKAKNRNATLVLDAGDISSGTPLSDHFKAIPMLESMNEIGYDAMTVGNHEFDRGRQSLETLVDKADFPILGANIHAANTGKKLNTKPYVIKDVNGIKVGILGLTTPDAATFMPKEDRATVKISDPIKTAKAEIRNMKKDGAEFVVVLSHLGFNEDRRLAKAVDGINVIVGGHSHTELRSYKKENNTYIVQAGSDGNFLGKLDMVLIRDKHGVEINNLKASLIRVKNAGERQSAGVLSIINKYKDKLGPIMAKVIGKAETPLPHYDYHTITEHSPTADFVTDAVRRQTGADVSVFAYSTIRAGLPEGEIKTEDIYKMIPWTDPLNTVTIKGKDIKEAMERGFRNEILELCQSGLKISVDKTRPPGDRITDISEASGKPIDPEKNYTMVTRAFLLDSNYVSDAFSKTNDRRIVKESFQDVLVSFVKAAGEVCPRLDNRLEIKG
ncbi:MAG: bifunctional metallophosphatase/5'-nucleotidase [Firmicutes bacterium]|nr:bifunctional metallophosphatase/5'-nucleotidase [Bacillota bacterium]